MYCVKKARILPLSLKAKVLEMIVDGGSGETE